MSPPQKLMMFSDQEKMHKSMRLSYLHWQNGMHFLMPSAVFVMAQIPMFGCGDKIGCSSTLMKVCYIMQCACSFAQRNHIVHPTTQQENSRFSSGLKSVDIVWFQSLNQLSNRHTWEGVVDADGIYKEAYKGICFQNSHGLLFQGTFWNWK